MMNNLFKEQFKKNNILDNLSIKNDTLLLHNFEGEQDFELVVSSTSYATIAFSIKSLNSVINIKLNSVPLIQIDTQGDYELPIRVNKGSVLTISGSCELMLIKIQGAKFNYLESRKILPLNTSIVNLIGNNKVFAYLDYQDLIDNDLVLDVTFDNVMCVQSYTVDGSVYIGKLIKNDSSVYFYNSLNNYTEGILVCEDADSAIFLQDYSNSIIYFLFIKGNKVYYKSLVSGGDLSDEKTLNTNVNKLPINLICSQTYSNNSRFFAIVNDKNSIDLYYSKYKETFQKIYEFKGKNLKIIEKDEEIFLLLFDNYLVEISNFGVDSTQDYGNILTLNSKEIIDNIVDCEEVDDNLILYSMGLTIWSRGLVE